MGTRAMNRFDLYELCVQAPDSCARFVDALLDGEPATIGEEFCGPASIARRYVALGDGRRAVATDFAAEPIEHAKVRVTEDLPAELHGEIEFHVKDVLEEDAPVRALVALNFALCELHTRSELLGYLKHARSRFVEGGGGVYLADLYGGVNAMYAGAYEVSFETEDGDVGYEWKQVSADPLTARVRNEINFTLLDGERMERAFEYDWRLWTPAELAEAFVEIGRAHV